MLVLVRTTQSRRRNEREHGFAKLLKQCRNSGKRISRSWRRGNKRREQRMQRGSMGGIVHENGNTKEHITCNMKWLVKLMRHDEQELLRLWHWDDNKGGWLDLELCAKARREEVERESGRHQSRQDGRRLTRVGRERM